MVKAKYGDNVNWNTVLHRAKEKKDDEFYTRLVDIEVEIDNYSLEVWENKVVLCNCNDILSAFGIYFLSNFSRLKLKTVILTHLEGKVLMYNGDTIIEKTISGYSGKFEHPISIDLLTNCDIVCTNPPFSRAIDYWKILINSGKQFLIISNETNVINTAYIHYFKNKKVWSGYNQVHTFLNPKKQEVYATGGWYTNFPVQNRERTKRIKLIRLEDIPHKYKKIDDSGTLLVDNCYIPSNYEKPFAVSSNPILHGLLDLGYEIVSEKQYVPYIDSKRCFSRVLIQKEK